MSEPAIEAIDVHKAFDRGLVPAVDGVTLRIDAGELVAITGPSGCGKSTFLHLLGALDRPDAGILRVSGLDVAHLEDPNRFRREEVGHVFQLHHLLPHLSALQNVEIAMFATGRSRRARRERAWELLDAVHLRHLAGRRPPELSGGQRQLVAIARALANRPKVLLADEPTGSLDSASVDGVLGLLHELRDRERVTIVVVTHDPLVAASADWIVHLRDGRVLDSPGV